MNMRGYSEAAESARETPTPPEGYRIIPSAYLEAGNPLPKDALVWRSCENNWQEANFNRGNRVRGFLTYATAQPLPCFQSPDQGPEHWADLCENDVIQDGDEWELDGLWHPAEAIGWRVGDIGHRYRRRVAQPTAEQASEPCSTGDAAETIERNPKSWAAWKREAERLGQRIAELELEASKAWGRCQASEDLRITMDNEITQLRAANAQLERDNAALWEQLADRDKLVADYRAQLAASEKDRQWQPIETAPKDGTPILACLPPFIPALVLWVDGKWSIDPEAFAEHAHFLEVFLSSEYHPTHWMPLPKAPDAAMKEAK